MSWTAWILLSAVFLALYDLAKKASVRDNAVLPVLLCSTCCGCAAFVAGVAVCGKLPEVLSSASGRALGLAAIKSLIVSTSWIFTFMALRTLPITIATPIRASAPALVFVAAFFLYGEVQDDRARGADRLRPLHGGREGVRGEGARDEGGCHRPS